MAVIGIVAIAENHAIGKDGKLPWHYPADLKFFKQTTSGNAVVMGINTWKSIGKALPNRLNIVLSRAGNIENQANVLLLRNTDEVSALAKYLNCDLFIVGGAKTYENFSGLIEKWIVTEVPAKVGGADTFMPPDFLSGFEIKDIKELGDQLRVKIYERIQLYF
ncbi:MAG TPA: dihydrofolate reductase [Pyrinomonadaceae bacterium]|nr:dihydrofolate reductase [Pyrinomonadaceae bacterium]